jgi:hypothetical protein
MPDGTELILGSFDGIPEGWILMEGELDGLILRVGSALEVGSLVEGDIDGTLLGALLSEGELDGVPEG